MPNINLAHTNQQRHNKAIILDIKRKYRYQYHSTIYLNDVNDQLYIQYSDYNLNNYTLDF